jgi:hypothetical protein
MKTSHKELQGLASYIKERTGIAFNIDNRAHHKANRMSKKELYISLHAFFDGWLEGQAQMRPTNYSSPTYPDELRQWFRGLNAIPTVYQLPDSRWETQNEEKATRWHA